MALEILGAVDTDVFSNMLRAVISEDTISCMKLLEEMVNYGRDLSQFVIDFTWYLRNMLLIKTSEGAEEIIDMSSEKLEALKEEAGLLETDTIMRYIRILSNLSNQIKYSSQKRVLIEIALIKLMQPAMEVDYESLKNRVSNIEKKLENGILVKNVSSAERTNNSDDSVATENVKKLEVALPEEVKAVADNWGRITAGITGHLGVCIKRNRLSVDENGTLCILYPSNTDYEMDNKEDKIEEIKNAIASAIGKDVNVSLKFIGNDNNYQEKYMEVGISRINFEVEESDDDDDEEDF